jgi:uncharacterized membrane protein YeaQ/YmgE (transglycosylase-associated protein family)
MEMIFVGLAMIVVGLIIGMLAGRIWKDERPIGVTGDFIAAVVTSLVVGILEWYLLPMIGISRTWTLLAIAIEPGLSALLVLWLVRVAKRQ